MNRKGFTLVELLVTIAIIGIVLSLGTYFVMEVVENSKEKAFNATRKSVLESAVIYANEFFDETDWVSSNDERDINTEKSCVSIQQLINKGYVKKEDFNPSGTTEKHKLNIDHVVVLKKDTNTKTIRFDDVYERVEEGTCINLLNAEITSTSSTTNSITVNAKCSVKGITPSDIEYEFDIGGNNSGNNSGKVKNNSFTYNELKEGTDYNISVKCHSSEYDEIPSAESIVRTQSLPTPNITYEGNIVTINYNTNYMDNVNLNKSFSVDVSGVTRIIKVGIINRALRINTSYDSSSNLEYLSIAGVTADKVTITARNSDGYEPNTKEVKKEISIVKEPASEKPNPPVLEPDDGIASGSWHKKNFNLKIIDTNDDKAKYFYWKAGDELKEYSSEILINNETKSTTYYAKACNSDELDNCSDPTSYIVKLDRTAPNLDISVKNGDGTTDINLIKDGNNYSKDEWIKTSLLFGVNAEDTGSGLSDDKIIYRSSPSSYKDLQGLEASESYIYNNSTKKITQDGNRQYEFKICDFAGNCTTKNYHIKTDITPPNVDNIILKYKNESGANNLLTLNNNIWSNNNWLNKKVTLYLNAKDVLSGLNNTANMKYNISYLSEINPNEQLSSMDIDLESGSLKKDIDNDGARHIKINICDNVNNCVTKEFKFNIDTQKPIVNYTIDGNYVNFSCSPLSGINEFNGWDDDNKSSSSTTEILSHYWGRRKEPIEVTCKSKAGLSSVYELENICVENDSYTYSYCCYTAKREVFRSGLSTNNLCSIREEVSCGNRSQKKYTDCNVNGEIFVEIENKYYPALNYKLWGNCEKTVTENSCYEKFSLIK